MVYRARSGRMGVSRVGLVNGNWRMGMGNAAGEQMSRCGVLLWGQIRGRCDTGVRAMEMGLSV